VRKTKLITYILLSTLLNLNVFSMETPKFDEPVRKNSESFNTLEEIEVLPISAKDPEELLESFLKDLIEKNKDFRINKTYILSQYKAGILAFERDGLGILPESVGTLTTLKELWIAGNNLKTLPESIGNLTNLQRITLNDNMLITLPVNFGKLTKLKDLGLRSNCLQHLPESFGNLVNLKYLWLNDAKITLPKSFGWLTNLEQLHIDASLYRTVLEKYASQNAVSLKKEEIKNFLAVFQKEPIDAMYGKYRIYACHFMSNNFPNDVMRYLTLYFILVVKKN